MKSIFVKRGRFDIVYEILSLSRRPVQKTRILYGCNLSYDQLQKYLDYLISRGLLNRFKKSGREVFHITEKGREFLNGYEHLKTFVKETQNSVR